MNDYVGCDVYTVDVLRLYQRRKKDNSVEFRFGSGLQASALAISGGYKSPQEAVRAWLESLPEQRRATTNELSTAVRALSYKVDLFNKSLQELCSQLDKTVTALQEYNKANGGK